MFETSHIVKGEE